jgi:hypothetical protein
MKNVRVLWALVPALLFASAARADKACENECWKSWPDPKAECASAWSSTACEYAKEGVRKIPRKSCLAVCWAKDKAVEWKPAIDAAKNLVKETGGAVVDKVKEVGGAVVDKVTSTVKNTVAGYWDKVKGCIADGFGGCAKKIVSAAGQVAKSLWDSAKQCVADGLGGCLCKGAGVLWDAAGKCCKKHGVVGCIKEAGTKAINTVLDPICKNHPDPALRECCKKKGGALQCRGEWWEQCKKKGAGQCLKDTGKGIGGALKELPCAFCKMAEGFLVPKLNGAAAWLINAAGKALSSYSLALKGSEIGALTCSFGANVGHTISDMAKKFGNPTLSISGIKLSAAKGGSKGATLSATLGATATLSLGGEALSIDVEGVVDVTADTTCNFAGPLLNVGARVTKLTPRGTIPKAIVNTAVGTYVNPSLGCIAPCLPAVKAAGMEIKVDYCKVIDTCLKDKCTAPVVNTLLKQIFPISMPLAMKLPKSTPAAIKEQLKGISITVGNAKLRTGSKDPYRPSLSVGVGIGPGKGERPLTIGATATLGLDPYCRKNGPSMLKITPSVSVSIGDMPPWLGKVLPKVANAGIDAFTAGGRDSVYTVGYPRFLQGLSCGGPGTAKPGTTDAAKKVKDQDAREAVTNAADQLKTPEKVAAVINAIRTAIAGSFKGNPAACARLSKPEEKAASGGGACNLCFKPEKGEKSTAQLWRDAQKKKRKGGETKVAGKPDAEPVGDAPPGTDVAANLGHLSGDLVNFRSGPSRSSKSMGVLARCTEFKILDRGLSGGSNFWTKVEYKAKTGYIAKQFVSDGPCTK